MNDKWYVVYETSHDVDTLDPILTSFLGGFVNKKDAERFLRTKKRENEDRFRKGWISFFIEVRPLFK